MNRMTILKPAFLAAALFSATAYASIAPDFSNGQQALERSYDGAQQLTRRGRGHDDGAGHTRRCRGCDDGPNHTAIDKEDIFNTARRGADDAAGDARRGRGKDDAPNHG